MKSLSIVVPVLDCERTIAQTIGELTNFLDQSTRDGELIVVDDGSRDGTAREVERAFAASNTPVEKRLLRTVQNRGKGHAVSRGMLAANGDYRVYIDADLAYPVANIPRFIQALEKGADLAIANRVHEGSRYLMTPESFPYIYMRHVIGRVFNALTRAAFVNGIRDTQAGLKAMTKTAAERLFPALVLERFSFDVELLFLAGRAGFRVDQLPVTFVYPNHPTTLALGRDSFKMVADLVRMRLHHTRSDHQLMHRQSPNSDSARSRASPKARVSSD